MREENHMRTSTVKGSIMWGFVAGFFAMLPHIFWLFYLLGLAEEEQERLQAHNDKLEHMLEFETKARQACAEAYYNLRADIITGKESV